MQFDTSVTAKCSLTQQIEDYVQSLHRVPEETKSHYRALWNRFAAYLVGKGIKSFDVFHIIIKGNPNIILN